MSVFFRRLASVRRSKRLSVFTQRRFESVRRQQRLSVFTQRWLESVRRCKRLSVRAHRRLRSFHFITHDSQVLSLICDPPLLWYLYDTASGCLSDVRIMKKPCVFVKHFKINTRTDGVCLPAYRFSADPVRIQNIKSCVGDFCAGLPSRRRTVLLLWDRFAFSRLCGIACRRRGFVHQFFKSNIIRKVLPFPGSDSASHLP